MNAATSHPQPPVVGESSRPAKGRPRWPVFVLPLLALIAVLVIPLVTPAASTCGGGIPGCGSLRNAGETAVVVEFAQRGGDGVEDKTEREVQAGERALLIGDANAVFVDAGQCLKVDGGPFWTATSYTDRTGQDTGEWHPIDDWGARVTLGSERCPA